ncbi:hypothetical protein [Algoriphagus halophilus]|uniref:Uncharacterized protein n=1 Tax=Algoriphagus halophilus TaxID=226505 RepID=A0A1N6H152_9BACT|nr:hypothetical protein [Algoriphagus halophilus]SIO13531.1 hypothetical protein SAMN05444394_3463 [Algoriphagus halophilus]
MKCFFLFLTLNFIFFNVLHGQNFDFIPEQLKPITHAELLKNPPSKKIDLVFYADGTPTTFDAVINQVKSGELVPEAFVDENGDYKALVVNKVDSKINYPKIPDSIKNLGYSVGNIQSDTVIIFSQGGPSFTLDTWRFAKLKDIVGNYLWVNVKQGQMLNPNPFENKELTFEDLKNFERQSQKNLYEVVQFFKSQNKKVFLIGGSGGGFLISRLIATYGNIADGYVITTSRLDMNDEMWKPRLKGERTLFKSDGKTIYLGNPPTTVLDKNINLFQAAGVDRKLTKELGQTDLSNVIFLYGKTDNRVGALSDHEIHFLQSHGALVIASNGGHLIYQDYIEVLLRLLLLD